MFTPIIRSPRSGLCCRSCGGVPGFGRYFPGSCSSFVSGGICKSIRTHILEECRQCSPTLRRQILRLERDEEANVHSKKYRRGSRRHFFVHIWNQLHKNDNKGGEEAGGDAVAAMEQDEDVDASHRSNSTTNQLPQSLPDQQDNNSNNNVDNDDNVPWNKLFQDSKVVILADRFLVPDSIFAAVAQTKACRVTEADRIGRCKDHKLGSMGLCCKHCGGKPGA